MTKSEDATTLIPSSPVTGKLRAGRVLCFLGEVTFVSKQKREKVLVPEPLSCLQGSVCCLFGTARWAMHVAQHLGFRPVCSTWQMKGIIT